MSAGGVELGVLSAVKLWQILTAVTSLFIGLLIKVLNDRNKMIEDNKNTISEITTRYSVQESIVTELAAEVKELSTVKDKVLVLEAKAESAEAKADSVERMIRDLSKDIRQVLTTMPRRKHYTDEHD